MAFLQSQVDLINSLITSATITDAQAVDLFSSQNGFTDTQITFIESLGLTSDEEATLLAENRSTQTLIETEMAQAKKYLMADDLFNARKWTLACEMTMATLSDYQIGNRRVEYREGIRFLKNGLDDLESRITNSPSSKNRRIFARYIGR
jgi:hypothetical protein